MSSCGAAICHIWQLYYLLRFKYLSIQFFLSAIFKRFRNFPIRIRNGWIILASGEICLKTTVFLPIDWYIYIKRKEFGYIFHSYFNLVEINKLHWLKKFDKTSTFFFLYFDTFDRQQVIWPPVGLLCNKFGNLSIYYIWNIKASNFPLVPYFKCFATSQLEFKTVALY